MMLIFCTVVQLGSQLRIENKNKNNFMKKRQLLGFCVGKMKMIFKIYATNTVYIYMYIRISF